MGEYLSPHTHTCPDCNEQFDCFCPIPQESKQCPDCWMQLHLLEQND